VPGPPKLARLRWRARAVASQWLGAQPRTAFVLSGGGSLGAVQVGMLRALTEAGIKPDLVVGASVGAINGASYAADPTPEGVKRLEHVWRRLANRDPDIMPSSFLPLVVQFARKGESVHDQDRLETLLREEIPVRRFSDLQLPFQCVATDMDTASEYWLADGELIPAILASAALPAVFPPARLHGRTLIDGGILNEVHGHRAVELGANELYILHVGHLNDARQRDLQRAFDGATHAYWVARRRRYLEDLDRIPGNCTVHVLPTGSTPRLRFDDFSRTDLLTQDAYERTRDYLARRG